MPSPSVQVAYPKLLMDISDLVMFTAMKAQRGGGVDVYLCSFYNLGTRLGWVVNTMPWPLYPRNDVVPNDRRLGGRQGFHPCTKNLIPARIRSTDRSAHHISDLVLDVILDVTE